MRGSWLIEVIQHTIDKKNQYYNPLYLLFALISSKLAPCYYSSLDTTFKVARTLAGQSRATADILALMGSLWPRALMASFL